MKLAAGRTRWIYYVALALTLSLISACSPAPDIAMSDTPPVLRFDGEHAFALENEFVTRFTHRHSGTEQNRLATEWLHERFTAAGWSCRFDDWEIVNYSQTVPLRNVVCTLPGEDPRELLVVAHHDQAPTTIQGADNDGSGIAILLQLAEILADEPSRRYSLVFVATDAEEYGMLGSRRFIQTHPDPANIIAGISLDNLGRSYYNGMNMELVGQFRGYGALWLALAARDAAEAADGVWVPNLRTPLDQAIDQAAPISFMDQGPMVAAGVPALGFTAALPSEYSDFHYALWHDPEDTMENQSAEALGNSGQVAEALLRQLLAMESFPSATGPYLYFARSGQVLTGAPLWLIFVGFVALFFIGSLIAGGPPVRNRISQWRRILPHFMGLWLPLVAALLLLYLFVMIGLMDEYHLYPATTKDPALLNPRWLAAVLFLLGTATLFWVGQRLVARFAGGVETAAEVKSFALLVIGVAGLYVLVVNPFSLLFFVPLLAWFFIRGWRGIGRIVDFALFALGGLVIYAMILIFGFGVLRYDWLFLWYLMNMLSTGTIGFWTVAAAAAIIAAGLTMLTQMPKASAARSVPLSHPAQ